jgi:hypothetical protein
MHIAQLVPIVNSVVNTLAMAATWTATKVDDVLMKCLQAILKNPELMDEIIALIDEHPELTAATPELAAAAPVLDGTVASIITEPIKETHEHLTLAVKSRFEGRGGAESGVDSSRLRDILKREGIDWQKWIAMLPMILQIIAMFAKK